jgi:4-alpha-glucanotransferase
MPLSACTTTASWGIGDISDLEPLTAWLAAAGQRVLQLLPINEMAPGQQSPYSAISAMAIDPIYINIPAVDDFAALGGESALSAADHGELANVRCAPRIAYAAVRRLKQRALRAAFNRFAAEEVKHDTDRSRALRTFASEQAWWLEDYALFRALHARAGERAWFDWPDELRRREPAAIDRARRELGCEVLFYQYVQWVAWQQWQNARRSANGVAVFGDLPFMVDGDSADVWARQHQFHLDVSVGAPPDAFSAAGQDWGMPLYNWDAMAAEQHLWLAERARRSADLYDGYRIDHLVGLYRTYGRPKDGSPAFFTPADEPAQTALGEHLLEIFRGAGAEIIAEDLGTVPDFVRASLARLGIPGYRVLRWERHWHTDGQPFRDPAEYPAASVAASGTHDTEPMIVWWEKASEDERRKVAAMPTIARLAGGADIAAADYGATVRDLLLESLWASGSDLLLLPVQDIFGWRDRINEPAVVGDNNWTFRLPWPCDRLDEIAEARARQDQMRVWSERYARHG